MNAMLARLSQHGAVVVLSLVALAASLLISIGAMFRYPSGELLLVSGAVWAVGVGVAGYRQRTWLWPVLCPLAMLALVMAWEVVYGRTSWASTHVFMLGVTFTVPATIGALIGTWLGRRRSDQDIAGRMRDRGI